MHGGAMTPGKADTAAPPRATRLRFDRYVLDLDRGCVLLDGTEIALRPKTFAVLRYLVENCGRLVAKDELFAAVWPNLAVTDDALVQSIGELRRALGDDGATLIRTIPRRGYRFESDVSVDADVAQSSADTAPASAGSSDVARSPVPATVGRTPLAFFATARAGLFVAFTLAVLCVAAVLWSGVAIEGKLSDLWGSADRSAAKSPDIAAKPAIAILPFLNQSDDSAREYFADGLTQDVISALGRFSALTVMSWNAVLPYKGKPASPEEIGRGLAVNYLVEGSVRQTGDRVKVIAQLVDTGQGRVLWSGRFEEKLCTPEGGLDEASQDRRWPHHRAAVGRLQPGA